MSFVYLLVSTNGNTYVGATVDLERRLRQHNKEIKGGAHATGMRVAKGEIWERAAYVSGFPNWQSALQFEWRWKQISRKYCIKMNPLERRIKALKDLLALERPTSKALLYSEWPSPPETHFEINKADDYFNTTD
jgi:structure-specific endonuclease subunit SLX1